MAPYSPTAPYLPTRFGPQPIGQILFERRLSITHVAREIGVGYQMLYRAVRGYGSPGAVLRERLPLFLDVPLEELFTAEVLITAYTPQLRYRDSWGGVK